LLNGFDRDRFIASAAIGSLSALPASGLFGRQASLGRPKACVCLPFFVLPSWTERPLLIVTESLAAPTSASRHKRSLAFEVWSGCPFFDISTPPGCDEWQAQYPGNG
jgi:hypothetical protein